MEPAGSPESSPVKSCASTPVQSSVSSPNRSPISSPIRSIASSPFQDVVSSPFQDAPSSPLEPLLSSPLHQNLKRGKYESCQPAAGQHCRDLFIDNFDEGKNTSIDLPINNALCGDIQSDVVMVDVKNKEEFLFDADLTGVPNNEHLHVNIVQDELITFTDSNGDPHKEVLTENPQNCDAAKCGAVTDSSSEDSDCASYKSSSCQDSSESGSDDNQIEKSSSEFESEFSEQEEENSSEDEAGEIFSPKIYEGCELTVDEGVLLVMNLFAKYKLSKKAIGGILKCVMRFIPKFNNMPNTDYALFEYVKKLSPVSEEKVHFYCSQCLYYLGLQEMKCNLCSGVCHKFYQIPLADQIRNLFEKHNLAEEIEKYLQERSNLDLRDSYSDLLDGSEFKRARVDGPYNLTLMGHTDGISVSESSDVSLWPLEWVVAELPPHLRFKYVLINGIWLDECKPYMNTMMKPFVQELQVLREHGVQWIHPRTKEAHTTYVTVPSFCVDAPVRAQLQNILLHGGRHCCHACEQKMKKLPPEPVVLGQKKKARRRVYTFEEEPATLRTAERMHEQGREARRKLAEVGGKLKPEKGVKGPSVISDIPGCDRSTAVFPEYMHLLLCVLKGLMALWFVKEGPWSLQEHQDMINQFLTSIRVPDFITRIPRSTLHYTKWKANELRAFLLYFSVIIFSKCMKPEYFQHWLLFVSAFNLLLQDCVPKNDVKRANILLRLFCRDFGKLYSLKNYTYYVHNLCHVALTVERHGVLHMNSAFMFESFNGTLAQYIHGSKNQGKELVNNVRLAFGVEVLKARCLVKSSSMNQDIEFRNEIRGFTFNEEEVRLLSACNKYKDPIRVYYRAVIKRETFTSSLYTRQKKRNNYTICYLNSSDGCRVFGEIKCFCESADDKVVLVERFDVDHLKTFCHNATGVLIKHIVPILPTGSIEVIELSAILFKVVRVENFVCLRPNKYEYNL